MDRDLDIVISDDSYTTSLNLIENVTERDFQNGIQAISNFQKLVRKQFIKDHDYGVIPRCNKPSLLKPGAEKLLMLLGLQSEYEILDSTRDFESGFFQYQIKCILKKDGVKITEGIGSCNTKESKYIKADPYTIDNTVFKMAKKRALVDGALLVGSLSDIFTQDVEDLDINGDSTRTKRTYTDDDGRINRKMQQELFSIAGDDKDCLEVIKNVLASKGYEKSSEIKKIEYAGILAECKRQIDTLNIKKLDEEKQEEEKKKKGSKTKEEEQEKQEEVEDKEVTEDTGGELTEEEKKAILEEEEREQARLEDIE